MPVAVRLSERPVWAAYPVFRPPPAILLCIRQVAVAYDPYSAVQSIDAASGWAAGTVQALPDVLSLPRSDR